FDQGARIHCVSSLEHRVTKPAQELRGHSSDDDFIFHVKNRAVSSREVATLLSLLRLLTHLIDTRQMNGELGASPLGASDGNVTATLLDDAVTGREAQAGPLPFLFRREERFEDMFDDLRRDAGAGVGYRESHVLAHRNFAGDAGVIQGKADIRG